MGTKAQATIMTTRFWTSIVYILKNFGPFVSVLRLVNGEKKLPMDYIYEAMDRAKEAIAKSFRENEEQYKGVFDIIDKRWESQLHRPLHATRHYLNLDFFSCQPNRDY